MDATLRNVALVVFLIVALAIPAGTILPVRLNSTLSSAKCKPDQIITARVMQDVPLPNGGTVRAGAKVLGHIVSVKAASNGSPASLSFRFDTLETRDAKLSITTNLRAIASFLAVQGAGLPLPGADRGVSPTAWTTVQIGGEVVYRGGGYVEAGRERVGEPVSGGVLARLRSNPQRGCSGTLDASEIRQALWLFSSDACGAYDLPDLQIRRTGPADSWGEIILDSSHGHVNVRAGAGLLLVVSGSPPAS